MLARPLRRINWPPVQWCLDGAKGAETRCLLAPMSEMPTLEEVLATLRQHGARLDGHDMAIGEHAEQIRALKIAIAQISTDQHRVIDYVTSQSLKLDKVLAGVEKLLAAKK
jgi:hypothetical protein